MGRTPWIVGLTLSGLVAGGAATAEPLEPLTVSVKIQDEVGISAETLGTARREVNRIFDQWQIRVVWVTSLAGQTGRHLLIKISSKPPSGRWRNPGILGVAAESTRASGTFAWLFYHRIEAARELFKIELGRFLGHVMAHEMGHLLLPYNSHKTDGLMKAGWDTTQTRLAEAGNLTFDHKQAATIRAHLTGGATAAPRP